MWTSTPTILILLEYRTRLRLRLEMSRNLGNRVRLYDTMPALVSREHRYHWFFEGDKKFHILSINPSVTDEPWQLPYRGAYGGTAHGCWLRLERSRNWTTVHGFMILCSHRYSKSIGIINFRTDKIQNFLLNVIYKLPHLKSPSVKLQYQLFHHWLEFDNHPCLQRSHKRNMIFCLHYHMFFPHI